MASFGHIADLEKKNMGIDIHNKFTPTYIISSEKKKIVSALKKAAKDADKVWIATDEDREGEAIGRHVAQALWLDFKKTPRIVFHEITKIALQDAIKKPRTLDLNIINAQQARRILDRLVWFELSPILRKKIKRWLSAWRVQSVAVRLIVDREREITQFQSQSSYKVIACLLTDDKKLFEASLARNLQDQEDVMTFLQEAKQSNFSIEKVETKPAKKYPAPPFTTSTLQQEASRKHGFSVSQTMRVAQKLYENWHITYMRTDSLNMSKTAQNAATQMITKQYGANYSKPTHFKSKASSAQEAHECIRPSNFWSFKVSTSPQEQKLYTLIRKRAIASQMSPAEIQKTKADIKVSMSKKKLIAQGEVITFDWFLAVYEESTDEQNDEKNSRLPALHKGQTLSLQHINATQTYDRHPPRYTEASLVKKLESEWIGRPSTYAPTIATIQKRAYAILQDRLGEEKTIITITLKDQNITENTTTKIIGTEKKKLFPTDIGLVVNDFLVKHFPDIIDYHFTAKIEQQFDEIAQGKQERTSMLQDFYGPFHAIIQSTDATASRESGERLLGTDPQTDKPVIVRIGRYGPLVQIGNADDPDKKFSGLRWNYSLETITLEQALESFALPRQLWSYQDKQISVSIGRFGPYIKRGESFVSIKKSNEFPQDDPYIITETRATEIIEQKLLKDKDKVIAKREHNGETYIIEKWRRGAFLRKGKKNIRLPKQLKDKPETITLEQCLQLDKETS